MQRGHWPRHYAEKPYLAGKDKEHTIQQQAFARLRRDKLGLKRSKRVQGIAAFGRRLEASTGQTMFSALAYYWVFWAGGTKSDGSDFDR